MGLASEAGVAFGQYQILDELSAAWPTHLRHANPDPSSFRRTLSTGYTSSGPTDSLFKVSEDRTFEGLGVVRLWLPWLPSVHDTHKVVVVKASKPC